MNQTRKSNRARGLLNVAHLVIAATLTISTISATSWGYSHNDIPAPVSNWLYFEQLVNDRDVNSGAFSNLNFNGLPFELEPFNRPVFEIGYLEIPASELFLRYSQTSNLLHSQHFFTRDGVLYVRYFIHKDMEEVYAREIRKYNYVKGEYLATPTSSPRSLVVWRKDQPEIFFGEKVSLYRPIGDLIRLNGRDKLERAFALNLATTLIPEKVRKDLDFEITPEPLVFASPGKDYGNIVRDLAAFAGHANGKTRLIPGFSYYSAAHEPTAREPNAHDAHTIAQPSTSAASDIRPLLLRNIERANKPALDTLENDMKPFIQSYAYLMFVEGLIGEPHPQNILFEVDKNQNMTGHHVYRDLDAFKPDIELRALNKKSLAPLQNPQRPYKYLKLAKAGDYYDDSYAFYIRDAWGFALEDLLKKSEEIADGASIKRKHSVIEMLDRLFLVEATRHLGSKIVLSGCKFFISSQRARLEMLYPHVDWDRPNLSPDEMNQLLQNFRIKTIFASDEPATRHYDYSETPFSVTKMVRTYKTEQRNVFLRSRDKTKPSQELLRKEYARLRFNFRTSTQSAPPEDANYVNVPGAIFVYTQTGQLFGSALLEPLNGVKSGKRFYEDVKYPRQEPNAGILKLLSARNSCVDILATTQK